MRCRLNSGYRVSGLLHGASEPARPGEGQEVLRSSPAVAARFGSGFGDSVYDVPGVILNVSAQPTADSPADVDVWIWGYRNPGE